MRSCVAAGCPPCDPQTGWPLNLGRWLARLLAERWSQSCAPVKAARNTSCTSPSWIRRPHPLHAPPPGRDRRTCSIQGSRSPLPLAASSSRDRTCTADAGPVRPDSVEYVRRCLRPPAAQRLRPVAVTTDAGTFEEPGGPALAAAAALPVTGPPGPPSSWPSHSLECDDGSMCDDSPRSGSAVDARPAASARSGLLLPPRPLRVPLKLPVRRRVRAVAPHGGRPWSAPTVGQSGTECPTTKNRTRTAAGTQGTRSSRTVCGAPQVGKRQRPRRRAG